MNTLHQHKLVEFIDKNGVVIWSNNQDVFFKNFSPTFLDFCQNYGSQTLEKISNGITNILNGKLKIFQSEYQILQDSSHARCFTILALPSTDGGAILIHEDITNRRLLETETLGISELEQKRIQQMLHDELCQILNGMTLSIAALAETLKKTPESKEVEYLFSIAQSAARKTHELYHRIWPLGQSRNALAIALQHLTQRISQTISCSFFSPVDVPISNRKTALLLYRIAQEACYDAEKIHHAQNITMCLIKKLGHLVLAVHDDGHGDDEQSKQRSEEFKLLNYRISLLKGRMHIKNDPVHGNQTICVLPLNLLYDS